MPVHLSELFKFVARNSVLTSVAFWRSHIEEASSQISGVESRLLLMERANGWMALRGESFYKIAQEGYGKARFARPAWTGFIKEHGCFTRELYWRKALNEIEKMAILGLTTKSHSRSVFLA